jgi:hypothetical protein
MSGKRWRPTAVQLALLERMFTGGPIRADKLDERTIEVLEREGMIEPVRLPDPPKGGELVAFWRLSGEGNYSMGGEFE